ncbi:MAG: hypothetical protein NUV78_01535 [Candidatus Zambryskibacteria bacterium]|nr:hypothetical protein [Candidatus Zambryskibacteria bacterium]
MLANKYVKIFLSLLFIALLIAGFVWWLKWSKERAARIVAERPMNVQVERVVEVEGKFTPPLGFPASIPLEEDNIVESILTNFPTQNAVQTSVIYRSTEEKLDKYFEYRSYMEKEGYKLSEGGDTGEVLFLHGIKGNENLSVTLSTWEGLTVVQIAHLTFVE